jgi:hypothetical protein
MKKFSFLPGMLLVTSTAIVFFLACQKENAISSENIETNGSLSSEGVIGTAGTKKITGLISQEHAQEMAEEFAKKFPTANTLAVGYSAKDLIAYLNTLVTKYKSDSVYVTFGVYNKNTAPNKFAIGRTTVFFMGKNMKSAMGNVRSQSIDYDGDINTSNYLNGGFLVP